MDRFSIILKKAPPEIKKKRPPPKKRLTEIQDKKIGVEVLSSWIDQEMLHRLEQKTNDISGRK